MGRWSFPCRQWVEKVFADRGSALLGPPGARHGDAKRRRDELFRERSLVIAAKTGYPFDFRATSSVGNTSRAYATTATVAEPPPLVANSDVKRFTADELAEAVRQSIDCSGLSDLAVVWAS